MNVAERWLLPDAVAAHRGVVNYTVRTWIAENAMPAHKVGRPWTFQVSETDDWVRGCGGQRPRAPLARPGVGSSSYAHHNDEPGEGRR